MTCRNSVQLKLYVDGIDATIDTQILLTPHIILFAFMALYNRRYPNTGTLKRDRGDVFS